MKPCGIREYSAKSKLGVPDSAGLHPGYNYNKICNKTMLGDMFHARMAHATGKCNA